MLATRSRESTLVKPRGALGRLEEISEWLSGWQGHHPPKADRCEVAVFAGSHGVTAEGVSAFSAEVTEQMVEGFKKGAAAINQLCQIQGCELKIYEVAIEIPTRNFREQAAMADDECAEAMAFGMSAVDDGLDVLCLGEMGIGNTTAAAAICHALYGETPEDWVGPGTGVEGDALRKKIRVVGDAVATHSEEMNDGLDILRHVGGRELAAIAGAIIAARLQRIPVVLDGYVCTAAAAVLHALNSAALDHCIAGHVSSEAGHAKLLDKIKKRALLDLDMRLGEASGAALAVSILHAAVACHTGMGSFEQAGVSNNPQE